MRYLEKTFWCSLVIHCISLAFISGCGDASGVLVVSPEVTNLEWKPENDGHQTVDIVLQNNGRGPLTIQKVTTTCSCTVVTSGKKTLSIGEKTGSVFFHQALQRLRKHTTKVNAIGLRTEPEF
jgi:hypothetical protein